MKAILVRAVSACAALVVLVTTGLAFAGPSAATTPTYPPPGGGTSSGVGGASVTANTTGGGGTSGQLASTGTPVLEIALIGAALLAVGVLLVLAARRRAGSRHA
jgi:LPXTG-motif cell wall-anchored protein